MVHDLRAYDESRYESPPPKQIITWSTYEPPRKIVQNHSWRVCCITHDNGIIIDKEDNGNYLASYDD